MKRMLLAAAAALSLAPLSIAPAPALAQSAPADDAAMRAKVDGLIARMTLEEKAGQLVTLDGGKRGTLDELAKQGLLGGTNGVMPGHDVAAYTRHIQDMAMRSRLKIPVWFMGDVAHGYRVIMPVPLALAATWDTDLVARVHRAAAIEATSDGVDWTYSPMLDIARDPRWGRVVEGAGEDAYLGSAMAMAQVRGFEGGGLAAKDTMMATAKHFAGYGGVLAGRDYNSVYIPPRLFRDVYLPPFKAVADAGIGSFMAAFTAIDGVPTSSDRALLTGTLRKKWGWDGLIVSDYDAVKELIVHGVAADEADAAAMALHAGIDVDLHSGLYLDQLPGLVRSGKVPMAELDAAVRRVLEAKYRLGLFDDPYRYGDRSGLAPEMLDQHRVLARQAARQAMVLLTNSGVLPLKKAGKIAVIGPMADAQRDLQGPMPALGAADEVVTMLAGIRAVAGDTAQVGYTQGVSVKGADTDEAGIAQAVEAARAADVAVLVLGDSIDMIGEGNSRASIDLPGRQLDLAKAVAATGKPVVAVVVSGRPLAVPWLAEHANALIFSWLTGDQAGNALGDLVFGDANFSGHLPMTVPRSLGQVPISYDALPTGRPRDGVYTSRYVDEENTPLFPFGYGLSYTSFRYGAPRLSTATLAAGGTLSVTVRVTNDGSRAGAAVPQLYVHDELASVSRPMRELKGFRRIELKPGEARDVTFTLTPEDLAFMRRDMTWGTEPGAYTLLVGGDSTAEASARFTLAAQ